MPGEPTKLGPFTGGLHNAAGTGEFILDEELFELTNLEVDDDGSLANRPEIKGFITSGETNLANWQFIGVYLPSDGRKFIVAYLPAVTKVALIDANTGAFFATYSAVIKSVCCIQYANRLWVVATNDSSGGGGYFDVPTPTTVTWTAVASMPRGESIIQYRERLWIACGVGATSNTSRFYFSAVADGTTWAGSDFFDVVPGNGQKLASFVRIGSDVILLKEHSTHRFAYTTDPRKAEISELDAKIGVPRINCTAVYNNNTLYVLHDNSVYQMFQNQYTRISNNLNMVQVTDPDLYANQSYGLSLHRDRLFLRYFNRLYVYSLNVERWSEWVSTRKFSNLVVIPNVSVGLDTAYAPSASVSAPTESYYFQDIRTTGDTGANSVVSAQRVGHNDYTSAGANVTTYNLPTTNCLLNDWVYIVHTQQWENTNNTPTPPAGFSVVVPRTTGGVIGTGVELFVWRKQFVAADAAAGYTVTLSAPRNLRSSLVIVRGGSTSAPPVVGPAMVPRAAIPYDSMMTIPAIPSAPGGSLIIAIQGQRTGGPGFKAPPLVDGAVNWFSVPLTTTAMYEQISYSSTVADGATSVVTATYNGMPDDGQVTGIQFAIPPASASSDPNVERFHGKITTKTYDFEIAHTFKVMFWWGISIATSGKFTGSLNIPNANRNLTYQQAKDLYGIWSVAQAAKVPWSSNTSISVFDTVTPTLGKYARKFIKLLKKVRFRQIYYTLDMDVITNNGLADASLRVYDMTVFIKSKETVVKETT